MNFFVKKNTIGLMGIVNVTPDSFSDGGSFDTVHSAVSHALSLQNQGADILDLGAESTRPNSIPVDAETEKARLLPVIDTLLSRPDLTAMISVDTYKASVADEVLKRGVGIINDVGGLVRDPDMADVVASHKASIIIMHHTPFDEGTDVCDALKRFFDKTINLAVSKGIEQHKIMLDIGIGFGKNQNQNIDALYAVKSLKSFGCPILVGASRKSMIGRALDLDNPQDRLYGTLAVHDVAVQQGACWLRVHDITAHDQFFRMKHHLLKDDSFYKSQEGL